MRIKDRIARDKFAALLGPALRALGARQCILRLNAAAHLAIPRQTPFPQLLPKLEMLCYEQNRPQLENEIERIFDEHIERRLAEKKDEFYRLSDQLNNNLNGERLPAEPAAREQVAATLVSIRALLLEAGFSAPEADAVFAMKAYPEVLALYLEKVASLPPAPPATT